MDTATEFTFPNELFEAEHQEEIYGAVFGTHSDFMRQPALRPKLVYRSDTRRRIYCLYQLQDAGGNGVFAIVVCDPSKEGPVNATAAWRLPEPARDGSMLQLLQAALSDIEWHINHDDPPTDRQVFC